jgi:RNA polymerase sigma factor (TIGR02999 family)
VDSTDITRILDDLKEPTPDAERRAWEVLYPEMLRLARAERRRWGGNWTLESRALAHEAYAKLFGDEVRDYANRRHFYRLVSRAIRQILVNYATAQRRQKRGGDTPTAAPLHELEDHLMSPRVADEVVELHEALERFRELDERAASVVELKFFAGLTAEEIAETLDTSPATVGRDWAIAKAWLERELRTGR